MKTDLFGEELQQRIQEILENSSRRLTHSGIDLVFAAEPLFGQSLHVSFDDIIWTNPGRLYRSTFQSGLERSILLSVTRDKQPTYSPHGSHNHIPKIYCTPCLTTGLEYVIGRDPARKLSVFNTSSDPHWPFTQYPLGIEINAWPYREHLTIERGSHDAIVITTPIRLEDITLIYSSHIDAFGSMNGILSPFDLIDCHRRVREFVATHNMRRDQHFLYNIYREPRKTTLALHRLAFGLQYAIHEHEVRKLEAAILAIAEKLHLPEEMLNNIAEKNRGCRRQPVVQ